MRSQDYIQQEQMRDKAEIERLGARIDEKFADVDRSTRALRAAQAHYVRALAEYSRTYGADALEPDDYKRAGR